MPEVLVAPVLGALGSNVVPKVAASLLAVVKVADLPLDRHREAKADWGRPSEHRAPRLFSAELPLVCGVAERGRARLEVAEGTVQGDAATSVRGREPNSDTGGETSLFESSATALPLLHGTGSAGLGRRGAGAIQAALGNRGAP